MADENAQKDYEEYAYVLEVDLRGRSRTIRGREGIILTAIGEKRLALLELLGVENSQFAVGDRVFIGKDGRTDIDSVLGKFDYVGLSTAAKAELPAMVDTIVRANERQFVEYINMAGPITPRIHALELIPGVGKTYMNAMLSERERQKFSSYADITERVGLSEPAKAIASRVMEEITGEARKTLFAKR